MTKLEQITHDALDLPDDQRAELADKLTESLLDSQISEAWAEVALSRLEKMRSGEAELIDGDEVMARILLIASDDEA